MNRDGPNHNILLAIQACFDDEIFDRSTVNKKTEKAIIFIVDFRLKEFDPWAVAHRRYCQRGEITRVISGMESCISALHLDTPCKVLTYF